MKEQYFFKGEEIEFEQVDPLIKRKIVAHGGDMMIVEVHFKKGAVGSLHEHMHEQTSYCIQGKLEFTVDGEKSIIEGGDSIFMPRNSNHGCVALEDTVLLDVFTPQRLDFLKQE